MVPFVWALPSILFLPGCCAEMVLVRDGHRGHGAGWPPGQGADSGILGLTPM